MANQYTSSLAWLLCFEGRKRIELAYNNNEDVLINLVFSVMKRGNN